MFLNLKKIRKKLLSWFRRKMLYRTDFSIISNNCFGGFVSQYFDLPYESPFVGLFLFAPDYIRMLERLDFYLKGDLIFIEPEKSNYVDFMKNQGTFSTYPIARLYDVELHFLHYKTELDAAEKWSRRVKRINWDNLIYKFCDRDLATLELIRRFDELPHSAKICLTAKKIPLKSCLKLLNEDGDMVMNEWGSFVRTANVIRVLNDLMLNKRS